MHLGLAPLVRSDAFQAAFICDFVARSERRAHRGLPSPSSRSRPLAVSRHGRVRNRHGRLCRCCARAGSCRMQAALAHCLLRAGAVSAVLGLLQYYGLAGALAPWTSALPGGQAFGNLRQCNQFASLIGVALIAALRLYASYRGGSPRRRLLRVGMVSLLLVAAAASTRRRWCRRHVAASERRRPWGTAGSFSGATCSPQSPTSADCLGGRVELRALHTQHALSGSTSRRNSRQRAQLAPAPCGGARHPRCHID